VDSPWLRSMDAELIETPGAGDELGGRRAAIIFEIMSNCDAAVLLVSATSPFSRTESVFLQEELIGRHVPRILVVVSNLDRIDKDEKDNVLDVIRERVAEASPAISVVSSHPVDESIPPAAALEAVRTKIEALAARGDRRALRSRQIAAQTADHLYQMIEFGNARAAAMRMDAAEREERLREARNELRTAELQWEGLRLELDQRCLSNYQQVRSRILATKPPLFEELSLDLRRTSEPRTWWEEGLPLRLRQQLIAASQVAQELVTEDLAHDFDWLRDEVKASFGTEMEDTNMKTTDELSLDANLGQLPRDELEHWRDLTKLGLSVTEMISRLSGLAASAISVAILTSGGATGSTPAQSSPAGGKAVPTQVSQTAGKPPSTQQSQVLGMDPLAQLIQAVLKSGAEYGSGYMRKILDTKVDEQRKTIMRKLERTLDLAYEKYCERVFERMRLIYDQLSEDTKREQVAWRSARIAALEGDDGAPDERTWRQLTEESSALRKEILVALGR
jgi:hypothetical protein